MKPDRITEAVRAHAAPAVEHTTHCARRAAAARRYRIIGGVTIAAGVIAFALWAAMMSAAMFYVWGWDTRWNHAAMIYEDAAVAWTAITAAGAVIWASRPEQ